jgi:hypothetical protein
VRGERASDEISGKISGPDGRSARTTTAVAPSGAIDLWKVTETACDALNNVAYRNVGNQEALLELGVLPACLSLLARHESGDGGEGVGASLAAGATPVWWTLTSAAPPILAGKGKPAAVRNTLVLLRSTDLRDWDLRSILLHHPDAARHAFQYVDWIFDGDDILAVSRTAHDDAGNGAHNAHDANFLTFHRVARFRELDRGDAVVDPATLGW